MATGHIAPRRLADTIVEQLETMILEGTLQPGERLPPNGCWPSSLACRGRPCGRRSSA